MSIYKNNFPQIHNKMFQFQLLKMLQTFVNILYVSMQSWSEKKLRYVIGKDAERVVGLRVRCH